MHNNGIKQTVPSAQQLIPDDGADAEAPRHRGCGWSPAVCPALRAGHPADGADCGRREQAHASLRRSSAAPLEIK